MTISARQLVSQNHNTHAHSLYSDGLHSVADVLSYSQRNTEVPSWGGISDHSPQGSRNERDRKALDYIGRLRCIRPDVEAESESDLLISMEVDWDMKGTKVSDNVLLELDYVLMAYHGREFTNPEDCEQMLRLMILHPFTDIVAHPTCFLGNFDPRLMDWSALFSLMAECGVACEYNLMTPMPDDIFEIAVAQDRLLFTIASDVHDFRRAGQVRLLSAWSEASTGEFSAASRFLKDQLAIGCPEDWESLFRMIDTPKSLNDLEFRAWSSTRRFNPVCANWTEDESRVLDALDRSDTLRDSAFLIQRLERFECLERDRILSLLPICDFIERLPSRSATARFQS